VTPRRSRTRVGSGGSGGRHRKQAGWRAPASETPSLPNRAKSAPGQHKLSKQLPFQSLDLDRTGRFNQSHSGCAQGRRDGVLQRILVRSERCSEPAVNDLETSVKTPQQVFVNFSSPYPNAGGLYTAASPRWAKAETNLVRRSGDSSTSG
jgi:hypothetical protein